MDCFTSLEESVAFLCSLVNGLLSSTSLCQRQNLLRGEKCNLHNLLYFGGDLVPVFEDCEGNVLLDAVLDQVWLELVTIF